jgi:hypothetical protein
MLLQCSSNSLGTRQEGVRQVSKQEGTSNKKTPRGQQTKTQPQQTILTTPLPNSKSQPNIFSSFTDPSFSYKMNPIEPSSATAQSLTAANSKVVGAFITYSSSRKYIEQDPFGDFINLCHLPSGSTIYTNK